MLRRPYCLATTDLDVAVLYKLYFRRMTSASHAAYLIRAFAPIAGLTERSRDSDPVHDLHDLLFEGLVIEDVWSHDQMESVRVRADVELLSRKELTEVMAYHHFGKLDSGHVYI